MFPKASGLSTLCTRNAARYFELIRDLPRLIFVDCTLLFSFFLSCGCRDLYFRSSSFLRFPVIAPHKSLALPPLRADVNHSQQSCFVKLKPFAIDLFSSIDIFISRLFGRICEKGPPSNCIRRLFPGIVYFRFSAISVFARDNRKKLDFAPFREC